MTDREKQMIASYLPNPPDEDRTVNEYFVLDTGGRVRKVYITDIFPSGDIHDDRSTYGVCESSTGRRVDAGYGSIFHGFRMGRMYDNREDCRNMTHEMYDGWERLRELQRKEAQDAKI